MTEHTPTPWRVEEKRFIKRDLGFTLGEHIANVTGGATSGPHFVENNEEVEANARRIVACVNALSGASTEDLEYCVEHGLEPMAGDLFSSRMKLQRERDELLTLLKTALPHIVGMGIREQAQAVINQLEDRQ